MFGSKVIGKSSRIFIIPRIISISKLERLWRNCADASGKYFFFFFFFFFCTVLTNQTCTYIVKSRFAGVYLKEHVYAELKFQWVQIISGN